MSQRGDRNGGRVLLDIAVEVADGVVQHIEMVEGESAEEVAKRFCTKFGLPNHFVAPLTEHIVSNLISIIEDDNEDIVFQHDAEPSSRAASSQSVPKAAASVRSDPGYTRKEHAPRSRTRPGTPASEKPSSTTMVRKFSDRIYSHTQASNSKTLAERQAEKRAQMEWDINRQSSLSDPVSERAKTIYMRLYTEFMTQKKKSDEIRRKSEILFQTQVAKKRGAASKYSYWLMRKRGRKARLFKNYGELLYEEGLDGFAQRKKQIEQKKKEDAAKEIAGLTWTPKISKHSHGLKQDKEYWKRLHSPNPSIQEHISELRKELWGQEMMECTFKPQVNPHDDDDDESSPNESETTSRFEQLFLDAENRQKRQTEYVQWFPKQYTFHPTVNKRQPKKSSAAGSSYGEGTVFDRLVQYASRLTEKRQDQQEHRYDIVDPATGQQFFKPRIGRRPQAPRNTDSLPVGHFLYQLKAIIDSKKKQAAQRDALLKEQARHVHYVGHNSQKIVERLKHRNLQEIFEHLDHDKDGVVELESADFRRLSSEVIKDIDAIKKTGTARQLSFREFAKRMVESQKHRGRRGSHACGCLVEDHKKDWNEQQHHKWKMNQLSRNLATRKRHYGSNRQWYRILIADRERGLAKIESLRKEMQNQEMAECTFRPELNAWRKNKGSAQQSRGIAGKDFLEKPRSAGMEREQQEVHGFIFQEANAEEGWQAGGASSSSSAPHGIENSGLSSSGVDVAPSSLGLLQSLRLLVAKSRDGQGGEGSAGTAENTGVEFLKDLQF